MAAREHETGAASTRSRAASDRTTAALGRRMREGLVVTVATVLRAGDALTAVAEAPGGVLRDVYAAAQPRAERIVGAARTVAVRARRALTPAVEPSAGAHGKRPQKKKRRPR